MIIITLVSPANCPNCAEVREQINGLKETYHELVIETVDSHSPAGEALVLKHGILASPGILLNDQFLGMGAISDQKIRQAINQAAKGV